MLDDRYTIGKNSYSAQMNEKTLHYNNLVRRAEIVKRDNGGKATKEEGNLYREAAEICSEIINLNISQRAVSAKWTLLRRQCQLEVDRIVRELAPAKAAAADAAAAGAEAGKTAETPKAAPADFTTKNANKEVSAETIASWFKDAPKQKFKDVSGMEDIKEMLLSKAGGVWDRVDSALKISPVQSFFFYGPPGSGKTFMIEAFASEMMDRGFKYMQLVGGDIHASLVGVAEKTVKALFDEAIDKEPVVVFIDEIENVCVSRSGSNVEGHVKRLTVAFLEAYNKLKKSGKRVIFMGATNFPRQVDEAMLDRITMIRVPLPNEETRTKFFKKQFELVKMEEGFSAEEMGERTENFSFRDMDRIVETILENLRDEAVAAFRVYSPEGDLDHIQTDIDAAEAIADGRIVITRDLFEEAMAKCPPSNKAASRAELEAFEASVRSNFG